MKQTPTMEIGDSPHSARTSAGPTTGASRLLLYAVIGLIAALMVLYSISLGFVWDEGFHLLAAQLINKGKTLYLDFCFPQTPLNVYWNALWMRWTGLGWRVTHVLATAAVIGSVVLTAEFVFSRLAQTRWRLACAMTAALATGLNDTLWKFGTCAQAYGMGTFLSVAAFRVMLAAVVPVAPLRALISGILAGAAAGSTLLTAPVLPVLLIWMFIYNQAGSRWRKASAFCAGVAVSFTPILWLFWKAPAVTFFNVVQYQALFRRVNWAGADSHDFDVLTAWLNDSAMFAVGLLAIAGALSIAQLPAWSRAWRAEFYLCVWMTAALVLYIAAAHPTFQRYFIFALPFLGALAALGLRAVAVRFGHAQRPFWPALALSLILVLALAKARFDDRDAVTWANYVAISKKIREVTPPGGRIYADEHIYFLLDLIPPSGMEFSYSQKLDLPPSQAAKYHIVSERQLDQQVRAGRFATVESCKEERIEQMQLPQLFPHQQEIGDCTIFWGKLRPLQPQQQPPKRAPETIRANP